MKNLIRSCVALCLLGTVACQAAVGVISVTMEVETIPTTVIPQTMRLKLQAAGVNGRINGTGELKIPGVITYPVKITSGSLQIGSVSGTQATGTTVLLTGFLKPRTGASAPITITTDNSGVMIMTINLTTIVPGIGKTKITF